MLKLRINEKRYGELFYKLRQEKDYKASELASMSSYSRSYICDLEKARRMPSKDVSISILKCFDIDYEKFVKSVQTELELMQNIVNDLIFLNIDSMRKHYHFMKNREQEIMNYCILNDEFIIVDAICRSSFGEEVSGLFEKVESRLEGVENPDLRAIYYLYYGVAKRDIGDNNEVIRLFDLAKHHVKDQDVLSMIDYHYGIFEEMRMNCLTAVQYNEAALSVFIKSFNHKRAVYTQMHIANNFLRVKEYDRAKKIYYEMIDKSNHNGMRDVNPLCINNMIWVLIVQKRFDEVLFWLDHEDYDQEKLHSKYMRLLFYVATKRNEEAIALAQDVILHAKLDEKGLMFHKFKCLYFYLECPEKPKTIAYYLQTYALMNENTDQHTIKITLDLIVGYYERTRKYKQALYYSKLRALL